MIKHYVEFYSPGTFVSEMTRKEIPSWDVGLAKQMARDVVERYEAKPFGFRFITLERVGGEVYPKETGKSDMFFLGGEVFSLKELERLNRPEDEITISNMRSNGWNHVVINTNSFKSALPLKEGDVVLHWEQKLDTFNLTREDFETALMFTEDCIEFYAGSSVNAESYEQAKAFYAHLRDEYGHVWGDAGKLPDDNEEFEQARRVDDGVEFDGIDGDDGQDSDDDHNGYGGTSSGSSKGYSEASGVWD